MIFFIDAAYNIFYSENNELFFLREMLFCCSSGSENLKPLVNGNAVNPQSFRKNGIKQKISKFTSDWKN